MHSGKPRKPLPVPKGSVDDENHEQSLTKDSDMLAQTIQDDMTVVDSALGKPTIKRSDDCLLTNLQLDEMIRDGDLHMILDNDEEVLPVPHPVDHGIQSPSISHNFHLRRKQSLAEAIHKALALGEKTQQEAKKIAKEYGKDVQTILIAAGLTQKATQSENSWNLHQSWYKEKFPKSVETSTVDWKKEQQAHWKVHRDETEHPQLWKEISSYITSQAEYYSRLKDTHVGGLVIYVGVDDKACQASGIFGGSLIKDLVNEQQADLKRLIDYATTVIKYKLIDPTASVPSFPQITAQKYDPDLHCDDGEGVHNCNHHVAPLMMLDKFEAVHIAHEGKNISWKTMLNSLYIHQLQVIDWPASVPPIGCDFVFKDLNTGELKALVVPYLKRCMGQDYGAELVRVETKEKKRNKNAVKIPDNEFKFEPWSDDAKAIFEREDNDMFNITLVTDTEGKVLRTLMDCVAFMKNLPDSVVPPRAATPLVNAPAVSDLPPLSPMQWDPSPPHHKVLQLLPSRSRPIPVPTKVHHYMGLVTITRSMHHQYSYSCTSNAVAGSSRLNTNDWKSKSPEVYYDDDGFDG
ncbi:hypothetical protein BDR06DRAFT_967356 [Suillus hirtellus]|nr:hypothetical protein BDR06DRAFT_967356 [Suillus hirtellus]